MLNGLLSTRSIAPSGRKGNAPYEESDTIWAPANAVGWTVARQSFDLALFRKHWLRHGTSSRVEIQEQGTSYDQAGAQPYPDRDLLRLAPDEQGCQE